MKLHRFFSEKLSQQDPDAKPLNMPPEKLRPYIDEALKTMFEDNAWISDAEVEIADHFIPTTYGEVRVRFYFPLESCDQPLPLYLHLHGGGWWLGTVESLDPFCKELSSQLPCVIASIEYSLSPEATFPQAPEEIYQVLEFLAKTPMPFNYDVNRIGLGGNSAGANLAAAICLMSRDRNGPEIRCQWLDSPATDASCLLPSYIKNEKGFLLTSQAMRDAWAWYLKEQDIKQVYASPLYAQLDNLPPAMIITAEYDPLCDDGRLYAFGLKAAGNTVRHFHYPGMVHGFMGYRHFSQSQHAFVELLNFLRFYL